MSPASGKVDYSGTEPKEENLPNTVGASSVDSNAIIDNRFEVNSTSAYEPLYRRGHVIHGRYKLLEQIGEGGMGTVYAAEQFQPVVRAVALKIIKYGLTSHSAQIRFNQERQALALMNHSNIAKVYDGGVTEQGHPYFAMEMVKGISVTAYCTEKKLSISKRLIIFKEICQAIQHAHQKGIIHRDLKPSNILVTEEGGVSFVKVIDFGVAKAVQGPLVEGTIYTEKGSLVGTLEYMSPEQAGTDQFDVDTRADIYSLGVILYEMLTGVLPFTRHELRMTSLDEAIRIIRKVDPPRPSTRLTLLGKQEQSISEQLPGISAKELKQTCTDLDWVVMKCLEKDRNVRYQHVTELSADIGRFLDNRPVQARPPTVAYKIKKYIKRNKTIAIAVAAIAMAIITGAILMSIGLVNAIAARAEAKNENEIHKSLLDFINKDLFSAMDVQERITLGVGMDKDLKVRTLLDRAAREIESGSFISKPLVEAALCLTVGKAYNSLGMAQASEKYLKKSLELRSSSLVPKHDDITESLEALGDSYILQGLYTKAIPLFEDVLNRWSESKGANSKRVCDVKFQLCSAHLWNGNTSHADLLVDELLTVYNKEHSEDDRAVVSALNVKALIKQRQQKYSEADELFEKILVQSKSRFGKYSPLYAMILNNLAQSLREQKKYTDAAVKYEELIPIAEKIYDSDSVMTALYRNNYAALLIRSKEFESADKQLSLALPVFLNQLGKGHEKTAVMRSNYAFLKSKMANYASALSDYQELRPLFIEKFGYQSPRTESLLHDMINTQLMLKDIDGVIPSARDYLESLAAQRKQAADSRTQKILSGIRDLAGQTNKSDRFKSMCKDIVKKFPDKSEMTLLLNTVSEK